MNTNPVFSPPFSPPSHWTASTPHLVVFWKYSHSQTLCLYLALTIWTCLSCLALFCGCPLNSSQHSSQRNLSCVEGKTRSFVHLPWQESSLGLPRYQKTSPLSARLSPCSLPSPPAPHLLQAYLEVSALALPSTWKVLSTSAFLAGSPTSFLFLPTSQKSLS